MADCEDRHAVKLETFVMRANDPITLNDAINTCLINLNIIKNCICYYFDDIININDYIIFYQMKNSIKYFIL